MTAMGTDVAADTTSVAEEERRQDHCEAPDDAATYCHCKREAVSIASSSQSVSRSLTFCSAWLCALSASFVLCVVVVPQSGDDNKSFSFFVNQVR